MIIRTSHHLKKVKITQEVQIALTSRSSGKLSPAQFQQFWRGHWKIENQSHYVRDVTFAEDKCMARTGHCPQNLAALRNLARGIAALHTCDGRSNPFMPDLRRSVQFDDGFLQRLLTGQPAVAA